MTTCARSRAAAQRELARGLRSARFARLSRQWRQDLAAAATRAHAAQRRRGWPAAGSPARTGGCCATAARSPPPRRRRACTSCASAARSCVTCWSSSARCTIPEQHWRAVRELKALQDCLGEFQDTEVQRDEIRAFAEQMMAERAAPAATLLAMGEIAAGLAARQRQARSEFAGRFRDVRQPGRARAGSAP